MERDWFKKGKDTPRLIHNLGEPLSSIEIATLFNEGFAPVFSNEDVPVLSNQLYAYLVEPTESLVFTEHGVANVAHHLPMHIAPRCDGIGMKFLKLT